MAVLTKVDSIINYPLIGCGDGAITLLNLCIFFFVIILSLIAAKMVKWLLQRRLFTMTHLDLGMQYMFTRIIGYLVFILGFLIGLQVLGIDLTSFTVLAGALGLGIGFGLQNIINNFVSGIIILSERRLQVEDRVEINGVVGFIKSVGARSTVLLTRDNVMMVIPNAEFMSKPVTRWGRKGEYKPYNLSMTITVAYNSNLERVAEILKESALSNPGITPNSTPSAFIDAFADHGIVFKLYFSTIEKMHAEPAIKSEIYFAIWNKFQEEKIVLAYPHYDLHIQDPLHIEMSS